MDCKFFVIFCTSDFMVMPDSFWMRDHASKSTAFPAPSQHGFVFIISVLSFLFKFLFPSTGLIFPGSLEIAELHQPCTQR
jgi:hypothetical protein